jgi:hypothetical protein
MVLICWPDPVVGQRTGVVSINPSSGATKVLSSGLKLPHGLAVDKSGLVIVESGRNRILRLPPAKPCGCSRFTMRAQSTQ